MVAAFNIKDGKFLIAEEEFTTGDDEDTCGCCGCTYEFSAGISPSVATLRMYMQIDAGPVYYYDNAGAGPIWSSLGGTPAPEGFYLTTPALQTGNHTFRFWYNQPTTDDPEEAFPTGSITFGAGGLPGTGDYCVSFNGVNYQMLEDDNLTLDFDPGGVPLAGFYAGYGNGDQSGYVGGLIVEVTCGTCPEE